MQKMGRILWLYHFRKLKSEHGASFVCVHYEAVFMCVHKIVKCDY